MPSRDEACVAARCTLELHRDNSALSLALDNCIEIDSENFQDERLIAAIHHLISCAPCQRWRETDLEPERHIRLKQAKSYCCAQMYEAIEKPNADIFIRFGICGPEKEVYWWVGLGKTVIRNCPWCGATLKKLPDGRAW